MMNRKRRNPGDAPANSLLPLPIGRPSTPLSNTPSTSTSTNNGEIASLSAQLVCIKKIYGTLLRTFDSEVDKKIRSESDRIEEKLRCEQQQNFQERFNFYAESATATIRKKVEIETKDLVEREIVLRVQILREELEEDCERRIAANEEGARTQLSLQETELKAKMADSPIPTESEKTLLLLARISALETELKSKSDQFDGLENQINDNNAKVEEARLKAVADASLLAKAKATDDTRELYITKIGDELAEANAKNELLEAAAIRHTDRVNRLIRERDNAQTTLAAERTSWLIEQSEYTRARTTFNALKSREAAIVERERLFEETGGDFAALQDELARVTGLYEAMQHQATELRDEEETVPVQIQPEAYNDPNPGAEPERPNDLSRWEGGKDEVTDSSEDGDNDDPGPGAGGQARAATPDPIARPVSPAGSATSGMSVASAVSTPANSRRGSESGPSTAPTTIRPAVPSPRGFPGRPYSQIARPPPRGGFYRPTWGRQAQSTVAADEDIFGEPSGDATVSEHNSPARSAHRHDLGGMREDEEQEEEDVVNEEEEQEEGDVVNEEEEQDEVEQEGGRTVAAGEDPVVDPPVEIPAAIDPVQAGSRQSSVESDQPFVSAPPSPSMAPGFLTRLAQIFGRTASPVTNVGASNPPSGSPAISIVPAPQVPPVVPAVPIVPGPHAQVGNTVIQVVLGPASAHSLLHDPLSCWFSVESYILLLLFAGLRWLLNALADRYNVSRRQPLTPNRLPLVTPVNILGAFPPGSPAIQTPATPVQGPYEPQVPAPQEPVVVADPSTPIPAPPLRPGLAEMALAIVAARQARDIGGSPALLTARTPRDPFASGPSAQPPAVNTPPSAGSGASSSAPGAPRRLAAGRPPQLPLGPCSASPSAVANASSPLLPGQVQIPRLSFFRHLLHDLLTSVLPSTDIERSNMFWNILFFIIHLAVYYMIYQNYSVYREGNVWIAGNEQTRLAVLQGLWGRRSSMGQGLAHFLTSEESAQSWDLFWWYLMGGGGSFAETNWRRGG